MTKKSCVDCRFAEKSGETLIWFKCTWEKPDDVKLPGFVYLKMVMAQEVIPKDCPTWEERKRSRSMEEIVKAVLDATKYLSDASLVKDDPRSASWRALHELLKEFRGSYTNYVEQEQEHELIRAGWEKHTGLMAGLWFFKGSAGNNKGPLFGRRQSDAYKYMKDGHVKA